MKFHALGCNSMTTRDEKALADWRSLGESVVGVFGDREKGCKCERCAMDDIQRLRDFYLDIQSGRQIALAAGKSKREMFFESLVTNGSSTVYPGGLDSRARKAMLRVLLRDRVDPKRLLHWDYYDWIAVKNVGATTARKLVNWLDANYPKSE